MDAAVSAEQVEDVVEVFERMTLDGVIGAGLLLLIGLVVIRVAMRMLRRMIERLPLERAISGFLLSAMRIVMLVVLGTMVCSQLGIPITSLVALLSLFALAVSLSVQDVLSNMVSGMVILIAKPFAAGDYIETTAASGTVESIGLMYTHLLSPDNKVLMIPNKELSAGRITNYSAKAVRRVDASVRVGYEYGNERVLEALLRAARRVCEGHETEKPPFAAVNAYLDGGVEFVVRVHVPTEDYWDVYYALMLAMREELEKEGIPLTYGTSRVHLDRPQNA
ncbi:MAG TPA: mechanosensitive ion channel family protein [Candidatus Ventricola intestinavium]|nr:mechanosensitive ion channel family protein [Candidatus Ventricola intestinavium]